MDLHSPSSQDNHDDLSSDNGEPNSDEHSVGMHSVEDVPFIIDLSSTEHVEDLEEHEQVENNGQMSGWSSSFEMSVEISTIKGLDHTVKDQFWAVFHVLNSPLTKWVNEIWCGSSNFWNSVVEHMWTS